MNKLKQLFKEEKKNYNEISNLLDKLYNIDNLKLINNIGIEIRIMFFIENIKDLCFLRDLSTNKRKKIIKEDTISQEENEEINKEKIKDTDKSALNSEEIFKLKKTFNNINKFAKEINNFIQKQNKKQCVPYYAFNQLLDGFINPNILEQKKFIKKEKQVLDDKQKSQIHYKEIIELYQTNPNKVELLFGKLNNINLEFLEENEKNKLIEISINIYYYLTEKQRDKIEKKFSELINDKDIKEIVFLNTENIFKDADKNKSKEKIRYLINCLSKLIEDNSKNKRQYEVTKKMNRDNVFNILLVIYKEFLIHKNKEKSFVNLIGDNIVAKIYYYLIINFLTYDDVFEDGKKLYKFLYVKYMYESKYDFIELIKKKEDINKKIIIYSEEDLKNKENSDEKLKSDDLNEYDNNEEEDSTLDIQLINNLKKIIPKEYFDLFFEIKKNISNFYIIPFPINILVNSENINFTFNILDMVILHKIILNNEGNKNRLFDYKNNLIKLEKEILNYYINSTFDYVNREGENKLIGYKINQKMKEVYNELIKYLKSRLPINENYKIQFIPFGSVTQFLSGKSGDIDLFLHIESEKKNPPYFKSFHQSILNSLYEILKMLDKKLVVHQTNRLCLFTIEYHQIKIDINVYGICSYFGEILLREYSLMDFRFPMLVIYLKHIINIHNIKNTDKDKIYINSFAWTNILLTFLQDILDPPLFPRLLNEKNKRNIRIKVGGGAGKNVKKKLNEEIAYQKMRNFNVAQLDQNYHIYYSENIKNQFYENEENKKAKKENMNNNMNYTIRNKMPVSEILLKFVQFIGYFFNYKYTMVNTSYDYQGFMPKIEKIKSKDEFVKCVINKNRGTDKEKDIEDILLIREPFDHTYNPCKSVSPEKLDEIQEKFREIYINILKNGEI